MEHCLGYKLSKPWMIAAFHVVSQWYERLQSLTECNHVKDNFYPYRGTLFCKNIEDTMVRLERLWALSTLYALFVETVLCTVNYSDSNNNGTVDDNLSLRLHLCVLPRPFVTVNPKNLSVYDSQTFALSCQLTSAVEEGANVTWYKDGVLISSVSGNWHFVGIITTIDENY